MMYRKTEGNVNDISNDSIYRMACLIHNVTLEKLNL